jgi:hypothetical protein
MTQRRQWLEDAEPREPEPIRWTLGRCMITGLIAIIFALLLIGRLWYGIPKSWLP